MLWNQRGSGGGEHYKSFNPAITRRGHRPGGVDTFSSRVTSALREVTLTREAEGGILKQGLSNFQVRTKLLMKMQIWIQ